MSSLTDVSGRKGDPLRIFSSSSDCKTFNNLTLQTENTTRGLNLSSEKYHLGCALVCNDMVYDRCVSNITKAGKNKREISLIRIPLFVLVSSAKRSNPGDSQSIESSNKKLKKK